jgi:large subunit ribosomal protein L25
MSEIVIEAKIRKDTGKRTKAIRREGYIPGIFYGHGEESIPIQTTLANLRPVVYTSDTHIIDLKLDNGENKTCIVRNIQFDPITDKIIHFDLLALRANEEVTIGVPIVLEGTAKGVKDGGMVQHILHRLEVKCLPKYIPEHIAVNISDLAIGDSIHVSVVKLENVEILEDEDTTIVSVVPPTVLKEPTPEEAATEEEPAEPELVGKGKKEAEEGEESDEK